MKIFKFGVALIAMFFSVSILAEIEGTYVIEVQMGDRGGGGGGARGGGGGGGERPETTLTISVDDEGEYSATMSGWGGEQTATEVDVEENEFSITFVRQTQRGDWETTYNGEVEDGEMSGTLSMSGGDWEVEFTGKLKEEEEAEPEGEEAEAAEPEAEA